MVQKIPDRMHSVTPSLTIEGAAEAIELYKKAFDAEEPAPAITDPGSGKIVHSEIYIGNSCLFLNDTDPQTCPVPSITSFYVYVDDVDAAFAKAKKAGLEEAYPVSDAFWGDRMGVLKDRYGITWTLATHVKDVTAEDIEKGKAEMFAAG